MKTPLNLIKSWSKRVPGCYEQLDKFSRNVAWPDYCVLPINAAYTWLATREELSFSAIARAASEAAELTACWLWRKYKIIYQFDKDFVDSLVSDDVVDTEELPTDLLFHPPYPAVYIKAPDLVEGRDGFFYFVDYDLNTKKPSIRVQWMTDDMSQTIPQIMHLIQGGTIKECMEDTLRTALSGTSILGGGLDEAVTAVYRNPDMTKSIYKAIQLILYLVAENSDISDDQPYRKPRLTVADSPKEIHSFSVGIRIGAAIRKWKKHKHTGESRGVGVAKRPHSRRGHWHHYWTGARDSEERKLILKWLAPVYIHAYDSDEVVIYPVKD